MNGEKTGRLIEKLTEATIRKEYSWNRIKTSLDIYSRENLLLHSYIEQYEKFPYKKGVNSGIDLLSSFFANIKNGKVYLFKTFEEDKEIYYIAIQSNVQSAVVNINNKEEFQEELKHLIFIISEQLNGVTGYLDKLLDF